MLVFGAGILVGVRTDIVNATPQLFGSTQETTLEASFTMKEARGRNQFPLDIGRGGGKLTGKSKTVQIFGDIFGELFFAQSAVAGQLLVASGEAGTIPAVAGPYTIAAANLATIVDDLGVILVSTGRPFKKVASAPATGEYSYSAGTYTFAAADTGLAVLLYYSYTLTTGKKIVVTNTVMGTRPTFQMYLNGLYQGQQLTVKLNKVTSDKLGMGTKLEDHMMPELSFQAMDDGTGGVGTWSFAD